MLSPTSFGLEATDGSARAGVLVTPHGEVPTPAFMPLATQGSVKALDPYEVRALGAQLILANTYHLYMRPGIEIIRRLGGIHKFMSWDGPILTDSGGFQGFSLGGLKRVGSEGIRFTSQLDGSRHLFTPEGVIGYQEALGADVIMPLDVCLPCESSRSDCEGALELTHRWARASQEARTRPDQALFGIVQGGQFPELRLESIQAITGLGFDGYAIGGLSVGEPKETMYSIARLTADLLPIEQPRYLMGVGSPDDLVECVAHGFDMFDCSLPTRVARTGAIYTWEGRVDVTSTRFRECDAPLEEDCDCFTCSSFSAAYLHHLFRARELLAYRLATIHNLFFFQRLMARIRQSVRDGSFVEFRRKFQATYTPADQEARQAQRIQTEVRRRTRGGNL